MKIGELYDRRRCGRTLAVGVAQRMRNISQAERRMLALSEEPALRPAAHLFKCLIIFKLCEDWRA